MFIALITAVGPMIAVVPVSAIAYANDDTIVDPTITLLRSYDKSERKVY
jgi:predicted PurR-regulated permease PerM